MKYLFLLLLLIPVYRLTAQPSIKVFPQDNRQFSQEKIIKGLVNQGVNILKIQTNFEPESHAMGFFTDPSRSMGVGQGMILSTGVVDAITGENAESGYTSVEINDEQATEIGRTLSMTPEELQDSVAASFLNGLFTPGDADLSREIAGLKTYDARVIEIDFIPTGDTFYYRYVFASEEYDEYVCSEFNDVFAFYLISEDGTQKNIALIPGKNQPVSVNSINNGNPLKPGCPKANSYLYYNNNDKQNLLFDGFTKMISVRERVIPGKRYRLKIAIADASDGILDSAILLESRSIFSYFASFEVFFGNNSAILDKPKKLGTILQTLNKYPGSKIQLVGHADQPGTEAYNLNLSVLRVKEIKKYLILNGIDRERIIEYYEGERMPKYENDEKNRRVEIFIMGD